jgi:PAS domain S-box-containing protein
MSGAAIHHSLDARLVVLSIVIAVMASYTSLDLAGRIRASARPWWSSWLPAAAVAMGGGIWSMHFIAMLAFDAGMPVSYEEGLTALSLLLAILVTGVGLLVVHARHGERIGLLAGGTLMGIGIVTMHYTGMAAMRMQATIRYDPALFVASVLIAIAAATAALWLSYHGQPLWQRALSALVMGGAIVGMHFTGMAAATLRAAPELPVPEGLGLSRHVLGLSIGVATLLVLALALAAAFVDRRLSRAQRETAILQRSERRFRALVQNGSDVIGIIDGDGCIAFEVLPAHRLAGERHTPAARRHFLHLVEAGDRTRAAALLDAARADPATAHNGELSLSVGAEPARCYEATFTNLAAEPAIAGVVVNLRDITDRRSAEAELRESEQRYRQLVDLIQASVVLHVDGRIAFANAYAARMLGAKSPEELIGRDLASFVHPEDRLGAAARTRSVIEGDEAPLSEMRYVRLDGATVTAEVQSVPLINRGKVQVLAMARDVTAQREAESQLQQALKMEAVGQLTGGIAHDFNNLLTVVIGNLDAAVEPASPDLRPLLRSALKAADRGAVLVQRLLAFSRRQALTPERLDLNCLAGGMADLLRRTLGEAVEIDMRLHPGLWSAYADKSQVENALLNLAINARDAMPGGGRLVIETANAQLDDDYVARNRGALPGDYVLLTVSDTGTGMTPAGIRPWR